MKIISDTFYEWMLRNFPYRLMYRKVYFGSSFISVPKYGYTRKQKKESEERVKEKYKNLKWE
jgi:hypothetical protein